MSVSHLPPVSPHYLPVKNGKIEYVRLGHGTPIVLINGYSADIASWDSQLLETLAKQHEIILFNNRNVGDTTIASSRYDIQALAEDTYQLVQGLKLTKPAILGYSMGGVIAQQYAATYPEALSKLILMNTFPAGAKAIPITPTVQEKLFYLPRNSLKRFFVALHLFFPEGSRWHAAYELIVYRFVPAHYPFDNYPSDAVLRQQQSLIRAWFKDDATGKEIATISLPTLILNGERDSIVNPKNSDILQQAIPQAQLQRYKDGGHAMLFQFPVQIAERINQFL